MESQFPKKPPPTQAQRRVDVAPISPILGGVAFNFEHLLNLASGRHKRYLLIKENEDLTFLIQNVRGMFTDEIFNNELGLQNKLIESFLYFCSDKTDLERQVKSKNKLELLEFLKKQVPEYFASFKME